MVYVHVRIHGAKEVFLYLKKLPQKANKAGMELTRRIAEGIRDRAKQNVAPLNTGTGDLYDSIQAIPGKNGWIAIAGRGLSRGYTVYQEKGFRPHRIWHKQVDPRAGWMYSRKGYWVSHWTPFMTPAYNATIRGLDAELNRTADKIIRG